MTHLRKGRFFSVCGMDVVGMPKGDEFSSNFTDCPKCMPEPPPWKATSDHGPDCKTCREHPEAAFSAPVKKPPRFIGIFPSQFPGWTPDSDPKQLDGMFRTPFGYDISHRFIPVGVSGIDSDGQCWVLVDDYSINAPHSAKRLRWVVFPVEVAD